MGKSRFLIERLISVSVKHIPKELYPLFFIANITINLIGHRPHQKNFCPNSKFGYICSNFFSTSVIMDTQDINLLDRLSELRNMYTDGLLSREEFEAIKQRIFSKYGLMPACEPEILPTLTVQSKSTQKTKTTKKKLTHPTVDLGLPSGLLWATCNVGAENEKAYGDFFAWGETGTKNVYDWTSYKLCRGTLDSISQYCTDMNTGDVDNLTILTEKDDVATLQWGEQWRMPNIEDVKELIDGCDWTWTKNYKRSKLAGSIGTSKTNGKTIFFPATGFYSDENKSAEGRYGLYWTASLYATDLATDCNSAYILKCGADNVSWLPDIRFFGEAVRPVVSRSYAVTFYNWDSSKILSQQTVREGSNAVAINAPKRKGKTFSHWSSSYCNVRQDLEIKPIYVDNENGNSTESSAEQTEQPAPEHVEPQNSYARRSESLSQPFSQRDFQVNSAPHTPSHDYVDLGLPSHLKWATCNIGATRPEGKGDLYAWGETQPKHSYSWRNYQFCNGSITSINNKYEGYRNSLEPKDDIAHLLWGEDWHIPKKIDFEELKSWCSWKWEYNYHNSGVSGYLGTSKINHHTIFFPTGGRQMDFAIQEKDYGYYWAANLYFDRRSLASEFYISQGGMGISCSYRCCGQSVRAVTY